MKAKQIALLFFCALLGVKAFPQEEKKQKRNLWDKFTDLDVSKSMNKMKEDYDESNFNYVISFLDNSAMFEAKEKGTGWKASLINNSGLGGKSAYSFESIAYNHLRQGEMLMKSKRIFLAENSFKLALNNYELAHKSSSNNAAQALGDLALLYQIRGLFEKAIPFCDSAIKIRKGLDNKIMLAVSLNNKGVLLKEMGKYAESEEIYKSGLQLCISEKDDLGKALIYNNLSMLYLSMNKLKDGGLMMDSALANANKSMEPTSTNFIKIEINNAYLHKIRKEYEKAEKIYKDAILIKENKLGKQPDLALLKSGLADLYMLMGNLSNVESLLQDAYDINLRKLGENHPATLKTQQQRALYNRLMGRNGMSNDILKDVVEKKKKIYGENHPSYIEVLEDLAITQWNMGNISTATESYNKVMANMTNYIDNYFNTLNDNEKSLYWEKASSTIQRFYCYSTSNCQAHPELGTNMLNKVIATKGFLLNRSSKIKNAILESNDGELKTAYKEWVKTKEHLNSAYQLSKEELAEENINIDSLQSKADELEKELSKRSSLFGNDLQKKVITIDSVKKSLNQDEAIVEIVQVNDFNNVFTGTSNYFAFIITNEKVELVKLGNADSIEKEISSFRADILDSKDNSKIYYSAWEAIEQKLTGKSNIYISSDGAYHQLSINSIHDNNNIYVIDKFMLNTIGNCKDIISLKARERKPTIPKSAVLLGNPFYGSDNIITPLPGTEKEIINVSKTFKANNVRTTIFTGKNATEKAIKGVKSPDILHIATHGYFLSNLDNVEVEKVLGIDISVARDNPLLRSGLLFANCEDVFNEDFRPSNSDNGVLTANEALTLNLDNTDLVVLSACETGLGKVKQGEGVYGLQRAFLMSGAKAIIMSLWSVDDLATMELMTLFYSKYVKSGDKRKAFNEAQRELKQKNKDPFYWGAFIMMNN